MASQTNFVKFSIPSFWRLPFALDTTIIYTCAASHLDAAAVARRSAASGSEALKLQKYWDLTGHFDFRLFAIETLGTFGPQAMELIESLMLRLRARASKIGASLVYRRLEAAVQRNARRIIEVHMRCASRWERLHNRHERVAE